MSGRYQGYPEYKYSGIEWLNSIPKHWIATELKRYCDVTDGSHHSPSVQVEGYPFISVTDVGENEIDFKNCKRITKSDYKRLVKEGCKPQVGDVLLTKDGTIGRATIVTEEDAEFVILSSLGLLSPTSSLNNHFLYYYLVSGINVDQMNSMIHGSALKRMTINKIDSLKITFPSFEEQKKIANFLDHETVKIDTLITKKEKLIELLKEKRQAVISHAVTRGLNPDAKMKDSGVGWLGEVPEHWEEKRLKYIGQAKNGLTYSPDNVVDEGEGTLVLRSSNIQNAKLCFTDNVYVKMNIPERIKTKENDLLICSRNGSRKLIGKNALITKETVGTAFGAFMVLYRSKINPYLYWVFNSPLFEYQSGSFLTSTINQLTIGNLDSMEIPLPPESERNEIRNYLVNKDNYFNKLIKKSKAKVLLLKERKTALISAAVTGKIDVRNYNAEKAGN